MSGFNTRNDAKWNIFQARNLISYLTPLLQKEGYEVGLTGSVLYKGASNKDLDLIVYPHKVRPFEDFDRAAQVLFLAGLTCVYNAVEVKKGRQAKAKQRNIAYVPDPKHVEVWTWQGKRVDIFFMK